MAAAVVAAVAVAVVAVATVAAVVVVGAAVVVVVVVAVGPVLPKCRPAECRSPRWGHRSQHLGRGPRSRECFGLLHVRHQKPTTV